jgi:hypothetical protein
MRSNRLVRGVWLLIPKSQQSRVQSQHPPTQWNLRGGIWSSVEYIKKSRPKMADNFLRERLQKEGYSGSHSVRSIDEWTIMTMNPKCRLFYKIDLLTNFAALCLTDFIDWRHIHPWLVFSTQLVNCCPHGQRNYTCVLLPLYFLSDLPPFPN